MQLLRILFINDNEKVIQEKETRLENYFDS